MKLLFMLAMIGFAIYFANCIESKDLRYAVTALMCVLSVVTEAVCGKVEATRDRLLAHRFDLRRDQ